MPTLSNDPAKKPIKAPKPDLTDVFMSAPLISSKQTAPTKGPIKMPMGPAKSPTSKPAIAPQVPYLLPPVNLVPQIESRLSINVEATAISPQITRKLVAGPSTPGCQISNRSANHVIGGPGRGGNMLKVMPTPIQIIPRTIRRISIPQK